MTIWHKRNTNSVRNAWTFAANLAVAALTTSFASAIDTPAISDAIETFASEAIDSSNPLVIIEAEMRSQDFNRRQQAMLRLWGDRATYRTWVEKAVKDTDPEVARRASWVLDRWRRGVLPDTPRDIAQRLEASSGPDTIESLLNVGLFDGALVSIDEAIDGSANPAILDRARSALRRRFPFYVRLAHLQKTIPSLIAIMDRLADDATMTLAYQQLRRAVTNDSNLELPSAAARWSDAQRTKIGVILPMATGQLEQAIKRAEESGDVELIRVCRMLNGNWDAMAREHQAAAKTREPDSLEWYRNWMYALIASSRAGDDAIRAEAIQRLSEPRQDEKDFEAADPVNRVRWQTLTLHGEIDAAIRILQPQQANDAAELLAQASRFADAFDAIEVDWKDIDSQVAVLVEDAIRGERNQLNAATDRGSPELARLLATVRLLVSTGREELAFSALKKVVGHPSLANQEESSTMRIEVIRTVTRINRAAWIGELLIGENESSLSGRTQFFLSMALDADIATVSSMMEALEKIRPGRKFSERVRDTVTILSGDLPPWFDAEQGFVTLFNAIAQRQRVVRGGPAKVYIASDSRLSIDYVRLFELHEQPKLAKQTLLALSEAGEVEATLKLAESELNEGSVAVARELFETVWSTVNIKGQDVSRINQSEGDALVAMKAIYGEATAARRLGDVDGASELDELIQWMSFTPSLALRNSFAEYLVEKGMNEQAEAIYEPLMRLTAFGSDDNVEFYAVARNYDSAVSETKPAKAAAALDLAIAGTIETTVFYPAAYISLPSFVHRRMVRNFIANGDEESARKESNKLLRLDPIDIDFGEKVLESIREAGMVELASEILERIYQAGHQHLKQFPFDVGMANNLSWVLSLSDHRLDEALRYSSRAVFYEPESTIYRDTLAEVLFRLGRNDEAIAIEKACLLDDPSEWHVHEQIKRFQDAGAGD